VALDNVGNLYVADTNKRISKGTPPVLSAPIQFVASSLAVANGNLHAVLTGPSGSNTVLQASVDLQSWTSIQTNSLGSGTLNLSVPLGTNRHGSFRVLFAP
jgi:hypothetical protein